MNTKDLAELNKEDVTKLTTILQGDGTLDSGPFYHGTKVELIAGDLLEPGYVSNYGKQKKANYVYLTATLDASLNGLASRRLMTECVESQNYDVKAFEIYPNPIVAINDRGIIHRQTETFSIFGDF